MSKWNVVTQAIPDDGKDGIFWDNGERFLREQGKITRLFDIAPHLEPMLMNEILLSPHLHPEMADARSRSMKD